jgi:O-methyltransferase
MKASLARSKTFAKWAFVKAAGRLRLEKLATFLLKAAYSLRFARWCVEHTNSKIRYDSSLEYDYSRRYSLYESVSQSERLSDEAVDYLEFGVYRGDSLKWWVEKNLCPDSRFVGFDSFFGFPEDWGEYCKGHFSTQGRPPEIKDSRCTFEVGLFQDTLPGFLTHFRGERRTVVHLDADLYSSTLFALATLHSRLKKGDILFFDEFSAPLHEFRAFYDFLSCYPTHYELIGAANNCYQVCIRLT